MLRVGIVTVSDRSASGERPDASGPALKQRIVAEGWQVTRQAITPDELIGLQDLLAEWADSGECDVILTTGGTGFSPRDITPEATLAVITRAAPGLVEAMRQASLRVTPHAMLSRAVAGLRARTILINLPGSPRGAVENLEVILPVLPHAVQLLQEDPRAEAGHHETRLVGNRD
ncbi:MAG: MogA/MoaB family molybdenum cofactor biosynthesis protein [Anaerolineales bacterium]|jgi:molybdenum cofactor synthesis domain-containing protein|nr:MogA/MoaB family molybdenum cofactor biosynthesis protein [Anaerolineales bacterium]